MSSQETSTFPELVVYVVSSLVDHPDEVSVNEVRDRSGITLELSVAADDMGRVIGKGGRVINAIRSVVEAAATKQGKRVTLELLEADGRARRS